MERHRLNLIEFIELLKRAAEDHRDPFVVDARIIVSPNEARLLNVKPANQLETIFY